MNACESPTFLLQVSGCLGIVKRGKIKWKNTKVEGYTLPTRPRQPLSCVKGGKGKWKSTKVSKEANKLWYQSGGNLAKETSGKGRN